jgi:predicted HAD superfamily Cof-like phosphohydrolase
MSRDFVNDVAEMHSKYKVNESVLNFDADKLSQYFKFRTSLLTEEYNEFINASTADDAVDALIDIVVIALGTLDAFDVDTYKAWNAVLGANMNKHTGIKPERPNPFGLPDLIKPVDWVAPSHNDNIGIFNKLWK